MISLQRLTFENTHYPLLPIFAFSCLSFHYHMFFTFNFTLFSPRAFLYLCAAFLQFFLSPGLSSFPLVHLASDGFIAKCQIFWRTCYTAVSLKIHSVKGGRYFCLCFEVMGFWGGWFALVFFPLRTKPVPFLTFFFSLSL